MEREKEIDVGLLDADPYARELPACIERYAIAIEVVPHAKGSNLRPLDGFGGFIALGYPRSYRQFFELLGWWAVEKVDFGNVNYGFVNDGADFMDFVHWTLHRQDGEEPGSYTSRHYYPNGIVGVCHGYFDSEGMVCNTKRDLLVVLRLNNLTIEGFDAIYAKWREARRARQSAK